MGVQEGSVYIRFSETPWLAKVLIRGVWIIHGRFAHLAEAHVVDKHIQNVGSLASVLLTQLGELLIDLLVFFCPRFLLLWLEEIVFAVVDDILGHCCLCGHKTDSRHYG